MGVKQERYSLFDMDKIIRRAGAQRVDENASKKLRELLEDSGDEIVFQAKILARHAGRRTLLREDILLAAQRLIYA